MKLSRREWTLALFTALIAVVLTTIPYILGYLAAREGTAFTGLLMNPEDSQTYFAKMMEGYDGRFLYTIPFTPEPHQGAFVGMFYIWLGHLGRLLNLAPALLWQLSRMAADIFLFLVTFGFIASYLPRPRDRWTAYLLAIFGSGLGWVLLLFNQPYWLGALPVDFKQPGAHLFFSALTFPHVAFGTGLTLISVWLLRRSTAAGQDSVRSWRFAIAAGIIHVALGVTYPYLIYLCAAIAILHWLNLVWQARRVLWHTSFVIAIMFIIPAPLFLYYAYTLQTNPVFRAWDTQSLTPALPRLHYLVAYGLMLLLGYLHWQRHPNSRSQLRLLWIWVLAVAVLLYIPLRPQRRFVQGVQVPLAILAAVGFGQVVLPWLQQTSLWQTLVARPRYSTARLARFSTVLFLVFMSLSNLYILASVSMSAVIQQPDTMFRPVAELAATQWLRENSDNESIILGDYLTGNYVAAHSGRRVVLGHWVETVDYEEKTAAVARFFAADTEENWRRQLLERYQVDYVWFGPRERALGSYDPHSSPFLKAVYVDGAFTIFAVQRLATP